MTPHTRLLLPVPLALLLVGVLSTPAAAQLLAYRVGAVSGVIDLATGSNTRLTGDQAQVGAVFTSDGEYAVRATPSGTLTVRHMRSGMQATFATDFRPSVAHPRKYAFYGVLSGQPARFDASGLARWAPCAVPAPNGILPMDLSIDGGTLFVQCASDIVGIDTETGLETRRVTVPGFVGLAVNAAATEAIGWRSGVVPADLVRVDLETGAEIASRFVSSMSFGTTLQSTPRRDRVVATSCRLVSVNVACTPVIVDAVTLADVRPLSPIAFGGGGKPVQVSPDGRDAFVNALHYYGFATSFAEWIDVDTGATRASVSQPSSEGTIGISYLPRPLPPTLGPAGVSAGAVTLSWALEAASPMAASYRVEAGAAPGTTAVSIAAGADTITIPGVPPGRYYVRIRAVNRHGVSLPSNEVVVDVP